LSIRSRGLERTRLPSLARRRCSRRPSIVVLFQLLARIRYLLLQYLFRSQRLRRSPLTLSLACTFYRHFFAKTTDHTLFFSGTRPGFNSAPIILFPRSKTKISVSITQLIVFLFQIIAGVWSSFFPPFEYLSGYPFLDTHAFFVGFFIVSPRDRSPITASTRKFRARVTPSPRNYVLSTFGCDIRNGFSSVF